MRVINFEAVVFLYILVAIATLSASASTVTVIARSVAPDGANPQGAPVFDASGMAYGTTEIGGANNLGAIYALNTDGSLKWLYSFDGVHGQNPGGALAFGSDGKLYGVTLAGGTNSDGVIFRITTQGVYRVVHSFQSSEGTSPNSPLVAEAPDKLLGTFQNGGSHNCGALFQISIAGPFSVLHQFSGPDGSNPSGGLAYNPTDHYFYGVTASGGTLTGSTLGDGTIYRTPGGDAIKTIHTFSGPDGSDPTGILTCTPNSTIYGVTHSGGVTTNNPFSDSNGVIFKLTDGKLFSVVHDFDATDGFWPLGGLASGSDGTLYGITQLGGSDLYTGTVYGINSSGQFESLNNFDSQLVGGPISGLSTSPNGLTYGVAINGHYGGDIYSVESGGGINEFFGFRYPNGVGYNAPLIQAPNGALLGTAVEGGDYDNGVIFEVSGGKLSSLHSFDTSTGDGGSPSSTLVENTAGEIFGITYAGGLNDYGTLFQVDPEGKYSTLYNFDSTTYSPFALTAAAKGSTIYGGTESSIFSYTVVGKLKILSTLPTACGFGIQSLVQGPDDALYGTTIFGAKNNVGTLFRMSLQGHFSVMYNLTSGDGTTEYTNLTVGSDGLIYGTTYPNGSGSGEAFSCTPAGVFTVLHAFTGGADGGKPFGGLVEASPGLFYGTTSSGGANGDGTIYSISSSGSLTSLYSFDAEVGGGELGCLMKAADGSYYGTLEQGGIYKFQP